MTAAVSSTALSSSLEYGVLSLHASCMSVRRSVQRAHGLRFNFCMSGKAQFHPFQSSNASIDSR